MSKSKKVVPATLEFVDIAGLVAGASTGEGLGNRFLAGIREVDAIVYVLRAFEDDNVVGDTDPLDDLAHPGAGAGAGRRRLGRVAAAQAPEDGPGRQVAGGRGRRPWRRPWTC